eukprot:19413-Hanusia_phi.AAC.5
MAPPPRWSCMDLVRILDQPCCLIAHIHVGEEAGGREEHQHAGNVVHPRLLELPRLPCGPTDLRSGTERVPPPVLARSSSDVHDLSVLQHVPYTVGGEQQEAIGLLQLVLLHRRQCRNPHVMGYRIPDGTRHGEPWP